MTFNWGGVKLKYFLKPAQKSGAPEKRMTKDTNREDLDDEEFDLDKYGADFDLEEELSAPIVDEDAMAKKAKKVAKKTTKKKTVKAVKKSTKKKAAPAAATVTPPPQVESKPDTYDTQYYVEPDDEGSGWWVAVLIILILVAAGVVYRYSLSQAQVTSDQCTVAYLDTFEGIPLDYDTSSVTVQEELQKILGDTRERDLATLADGKTALVLSLASVEDIVPDVRTRSCASGGDSITCGGTEVDLETLEPSADLASVLLVDGATRLETFDGDGALVIFKDGDELVALETESHETLAVRLFAGDRTLTTAQLKYVTTSPRIVTWQLQE